MNADRTRLRLSRWEISAVGCVLLVGWFFILPEMAMGQSTPTDMSPHADMRDQPFLFHGPVEPSVVKADGVYRIGLFVPVSGPRAEQGGAMLADGATLALAHWNRAHPHQLAVLVQASDDSVWGSAREVVDLAYRHQVVGMIGGLGAESTHVAEQIAVKARLPLIAPATSDPSLTQVAIPWMFRLMPDDETYAAELVKRLLQRGARPRIGLLGSGLFDDRMYAKEILQAAAAAGLPIVWHRLYDPGLPPDEDEAAWFQAVAPIDCLVFLGGPETPRPWLEFARSRTSGPVIYGPRFSWSPVDRSALAPFTGGMLQAPCDWWCDRDERHAFIQAFQEAYNRLPSMLAGYAYDAATALLNACSRSDGARADLLKWMAATDALPGATGCIQFDGTGGTTAMPVMIEIP